MPYYNRDPKRAHNFDNHPFVSRRTVWGISSFKQITDFKHSSENPSFGSRLYSYNWNLKSHPLNPKPCFNLAVVQIPFLGFGQLQRKSVILSRLLSRNFRGAYFHMWVNLGHQLGYQHLRDLIVFLGPSYACYPNLF